MERLFVFADFNWLDRPELVGKLCYEKLLTVRLKRAESPKALSPGHRPGYNGNQQDAL